MKISHKFVAAMTLVVVAVLGTSHAFSVSREEKFYASSMRANHLAIARAVLALRSPGATEEADAHTADLEVQIAAPTSANEGAREGGEFVTRVPIEGSDEALIVRESPARYDALRRGLSEQWALTAFAIVAIAAVVMLVLGAAIIGRPIDRIVQDARRIGAGDFNRAAPLPQRDEIGVLSREIGRMCDQIREAQDRARDESARRAVAMDQLRRVDRLTTASHLGAGIAHELGTPLNVVRGRAEIIAAESLSSSLSQKSARIIVEQVDRMSAILRQLLDFTRRGKTAVARCDLGELARQALDLLASTAKKQSVELTVVAAEPGVALRADPGLLGQVILNLVVNGIQARRDEGGTVRVEVDAEDANDRRWARLRVVDDGVGIAPEHLAQVFEPFFTTKESGVGTGLGLWISREIVAELGGAIEVESELGKGTCFIVRLPVAETMEATS